MKNIILALLLASLLGGCAAQEPLNKHTQSGYPEAVFAGEGTESVRGKVTQGCLNKGLMIEDSSSSQVVCSADITDTLAVMKTTLMLNGNANSSNHRTKIRFIIFGNSEGTKVTAQPTVELQMAGGATRSARLTSNSDLNGLQYFLDSLNVASRNAPPVAEPLYGPRIRK